MPSFPPPSDDDTQQPQDPAVARMIQRLKNFDTLESRLKGFAFQPRATDILITTTPKAATTWLQQICHQLRSKGDMDFDEISEVVPWLELNMDMGLPDLDAIPQTNPRLFKTHAWEPHCPKGPAGQTKYIVGIRRPEDVVDSFHRFFDGWFIQPKGSVTLEAFARDFFLKRGIPQSKNENPSCWHHLISWWAHIQESDPTVLCVAFEDLKMDLEGQVRRIARFMGYDPHTEDYEERVQVAVAHSFFDFMRAHNTQFDEHMTKAARNEICGLPKDAGKENSKVQNGKMDVGRETISPELKEAFRKRWTEVVTPTTGFADYDELLQWHRAQQHRAQQQEGK